jgi:hypothetical protein
MFCGEYSQGAIPCCEGYRCVDDECVACLTEGNECAGDGDCCDGICCGGSCQALECCIEDADPNARCPEGTACFEGICDPIGGCVARDDDCTSTGECCGELLCLDGVCAPATDDDGSAGGVTTLPSTGVRTGDAGNGAVLGLGLAAGATFLAGRKLRRDRAGAAK